MVHGRRATRIDYFLVTYYTLAVAGLVTLRAVLGALDFLGVGWILALAAIPLLPWLVPRLGGFVERISPSVQRLKIGLFEIELRAVSEKPTEFEELGGQFALDQVAAAGSPTMPFDGTAVSEIVAGLVAVRRRAGAVPMLVVDLKNGHRWALPNLYFLARLLEVEAFVDQLLFTEARGGTDGYLLGSCRAGDLRRNLELDLPDYATNKDVLILPADLTALTDLAEAQALAGRFKTFRETLPKSGGDDDPLRAWLTSDRIRRLLGGLLTTTALDEPGRMLTEEEIRTVIASPHRWVPTTSGGLLSGAVDREAVALQLARAAIAQADDRWPRALVRRQTRH